MTVALANPRDRLLEFLQRLTQKFFMRVSECFFVLLLDPRHVVRLIFAQDPAGGRPSSLQESKAAEHLGYLRGVEGAGGCRRATKCSTVLFD